MSNRIKITISLFVFIGFIGLILISDGFDIPDNITVSESYDGFPVIVLDAGHGGYDPGAVKDDILEKDINLSITQRTRDVLILLGFETMLTRNDDKALGNNKATDLKNRVNLANSYDNAYFISIHQNMFEKSKYYGSQVFYGGCKGEDLAKQIQSSIISHLQNDNKRVVKNGNYLYVLEHTDNTSVMIECGFMSNPSELEKLTNENYQNSLSYIIGISILGFVLDESSV